MGSCLCFRFKLWWMTQRMGMYGKDIPLETQFMLVESKDDSSQEDSTIYTVFLPLLEGQFKSLFFKETIRMKLRYVLRAVSNCIHMTAMKPPQSRFVYTRHCSTQMAKCQTWEEKFITVILKQDLEFGGDNAVETNQGLHTVYMHAGTNPFEVINQPLKDDGEETMVYRVTVEPIIPAIFQRTKATCFAYGQTGRLNQAFSQDNSVYGNGSYSNSLSVEFVEITLNVQDDDTVLLRSVEPATSTNHDGNGTDTPMSSKPSTMKRTSSSKLLHFSQELKAEAITKAKQFSQELKVEFQRKFSRNHSLCVESTFEIFFFFKS
ncbi:hypothetical protein IFM89_000723 [Coptis chinensis]|uniref:Uncharacterized protein n=1 Tax=Coptis chinensis TaxID=261450 RepID=A0A835ITQ9_9MAGN|nr:hypothetical protein IFM89_000723 [Coptis chinensis]